MGASSRNRGDSVKTIWRVATGIAVVATAVASFYGVKRKNEASRPVEYREVAVARGDLAVKILATGVVQPENRLEIKPPIPGRVEAVLVKEGGKIAKGERLALMSSSERAALLDAARGKGEEEVKRWEEFYQAAPILAPISGTLILRAVEPGQTVTSADTLLVMSDRLTVKTQVDETDIAEIRLRQRADVVLDAYPNETIPARVDEIAYEAKTVNNVTTYLVDVLPDHAPASMRSGMTANVSFHATFKGNVLRIPTNALTTREKRSFVLLAGENPREKPVEREITTGLSDGKFVEVISGLSEGARILVSQLKVDPDGGSKAPTNPFAPFAGRRPR
jgi:macrolide-specific efflux system membrane fusion protein